MILSAIANLQVNQLPSSRAVAEDANTAQRSRWLARELMLTAYSYFGGEQLGAPCGLLCW
jgi:hypothetical protein